MISASEAPETSLDEWFFDFHVAAVEPVSRLRVDDLLWVVAIAWAEAHGLGIGGGYRPTSPEVGGTANGWRFRFGLCVQEDSRSILASQAAELREVLRGWCVTQGLVFDGDFRAFTQDERNPAA